MAEPFSFSSLRVCVNQREQNASEEDSQAERLSFLLFLGGGGVEGREDGKVEGEGSESCLD